MELREKLAELCHKQWSGWMEWMFLKGFIEKYGEHENCFIIPESWHKRWSRQINTPYADLPDNEKESDRKEADRILEIINTRPDHGGVEKDKVIQLATEAGFAISTVCGQEVTKLMPISDTDTLVRFANNIIKSLSHKDKTERKKNGTGYAEG